MIRTNRIQAIGLVAVLVGGIFAVQAGNLDILVFGEAAPDDCDASKSIGSADGFGYGYGYDSAGGYGYGFGFDGGYGYEAGHYQADSDEGHGNSLGHGDSEGYGYGSSVDCQPLSKPDNFETEVKVSFPASNGLVQGSELGLFTAEDNELHITGELRNDFIGALEELDVAVPALFPCPPGAPSTAEQGADNTCLSLVGLVGGTDIVVIEVGEGKQNADGTGDDCNPGLWLYAPAAGAPRGNALQCVPEGLSSSSMTLEANPTTWERIKGWFSEFQFTAAAQGPLDDDDGDGVPNGIDLCPGTDPGATVDPTGCEIGGGGGADPPEMDIPLGELHLKIRKAGEATFLVDTEDAAEPVCTAEIRASINLFEMCGRWSYDWSVLTAGVPDIENGVYEIIPCYRSNLDDFPVIFEGDVGCEEEDAHPFYVLLTQHGVQFTSLDHGGGELEPGETVTIGYDVKNFGVGTDAYGLEGIVTGVTATLDLDGAAGLQATSTTQELAALATESRTFDLVVDASALPGTAFTVDLEASSQLAAAKSWADDSATAVVTLFVGSPDQDGDGVADGIDNCPMHVNPAQLDTDGDLMGDACDADDDGDGVDDVEDAFPLDDTEWLDTDGDGTGDNADSDDDNDLILDGNDACPKEVPTGPDNDGDGCKDDNDPDDDNDGVDDVNDDFPLDPTETTDTDGDGTGDNADPDDDNDGHLDGDDDCPRQFPLGTDNNDDGCTDATGGGVGLTDGDGDGVKDNVDNCVAISNADQADLDGDGIGDVCDADRDGDGVPNDDDAFPDDGLSFADSDGDGVGDGRDICPGSDDGDDQDGDGIPDGCDTDRDGDGVANTDDAFPDDANESKDSDGDGVGDGADQCEGHDDGLDQDGDGTPDGCDDDRDGDGILNTLDLFPDDPTESKDSDGDGIGDNKDICPNVADPSQLDLDGDRVGDACDTVDDRFTDLDGDLLLGIHELELGTDPLNPDTDGDGIPDGREVDTGTDPLDANDPSRKPVRVVPIVHGGLVHTIFEVVDSGLVDHYNVFLHSTPEYKATVDHQVGKSVYLVPGFSVPAGTHRVGVIGVGLLGSDDYDADAEFLSAPFTVDGLDLSGCEGKVDRDDDGLCDELEELLGTDPNDADTDGDGLLDGDEIRGTNGGPSNPWAKDSDGDGVDDLQERADTTSSLDSSDFVVVESPNVGTEWAFWVGLALTVACIVVLGRTAVLFARRSTAA